MPSSLRALAAIGWALVASLLPATACSDDDSSAADDDDTSSVSSGSSSGSGGSGAQFASGIVIDGVELNQGVGVTLVKGGGLLATDDQVAPLLAGRPGVMRAFWQLDEGFAPRAIEARLLLSYSDGETTTLSDSITVSGPPDPSQLDGAFSFMLDASQLRPATSWQLSLHEVAGGGPGRVPVKPPRIPAAGPESLGLWNSPMQLDVVIVPATLNCTPNGPIVISAQDRTSIEGQIYNLYPLSSLNLQFHDPVTLQVSSCNDSTAVLAALSALRDSEAIGPSYYYHAIFSHDDQDGFDDGGYSWLLSDTSMGADRVSYSVNYWPDEPNNVTHELGHNHGREHTFDDPGYLPSAGAGPTCGRRSSWGFGLLPWQHPQDERVSFPQLANVQGWLVPPTENLGYDSGANVCLGHEDVSKGPAFNDFMGYSSPYWVSAYTYAAIAQRVRTISAWATSDQTNALWFERRSLHGYFLKDGSTHWQIGRGDAAADSAALLDRHNRARLTLPTVKPPGSHGLDLPVALKRSGEGTIGGVAIALPANFTLPDQGSFEVILAGISRRGRWSEVRRLGIKP